MCKLRQRGGGYGGPAGSRRIDPSSQPLPPCSVFNIGVALSADCFESASGLFRPVPRTAHERCEREVETSARMAFCLKGKTESIINHDKDAVCAG